MGFIAHTEPLRRAVLAQAARSIRALVLALLLAGPSAVAHELPPGEFDLNRDGVPDAVVRQVRASRAESVWSRIVVQSGADGEVLLAVIGADSNDIFGWVVSNIGDIDGDGIPDLAVAAPRGRTPEVGEASGDAATVNALGRVHLISGADGLIVRSIGADRPGYFGFALRPVADFDGDGLGDLLVGAVQPADGAGLNGARVFTDYWALASTGTGDLLGTGEGRIGEPFRDVLSSAREFWAEGVANGSRTTDIGMGGDLEADGDVDFADLLWLLANWGGDGASRSHPRFAARGDIDGSGSVGFSDLILVLQQFGRQGAGSSTATRHDCSEYSYYDWGPWDYCICHHCEMMCPDFGCDGCYPDCGGPPPPASIDVLIDCNHDGTIDLADRNCKDGRLGRVILMNMDDDNANGVPDNYDTGGFTDDELVEMVIQGAPAPYDVQAAFWSVSDTGFNLRFYRDRERTVAIGNGLHYGLPPPPSLFIEGWYETNWGAVTIHVYVNNGGDFDDCCASDSVEATVVDPHYHGFGDVPVDEPEAFLAIDISLPTQNGGRDVLPELDGIPVTASVWVAGSEWIQSDATLEDGLSIHSMPVPPVAGTQVRFEAQLLQACWRGPFVPGWWSQKILPGIPVSFGSVEGHANPMVADGRGVRAFLLPVLDQFGNLWPEELADVGFLVSEGASHAFAYHSWVSYRAAALQSDEPLRVRASIGLANETYEIEPLSLTGLLLPTQPSLDIANGEQALVTLTTNASEGSEIFWTVSNGAVRTHETVVANGSSSIEIPTAGGNVNIGPCVVTATIASRLFVTTIDFVDSSSVTLRFERPVICGDVAEDGIAQVPFAQLTPIPGFPPTIPETTRPTPYFATTNALVSGEPWGVYLVEFVDPSHSSFVELVGLSDEGLIVLDDSGHGEFAIRSRGTMPSDMRLRVPLRVVDAGPARGGWRAEREQDLTLVPFDDWIYVKDAIRSFFGGDPQSWYGFGGNIAGGLMPIVPVGDIGALAKNVYRMGWWSDVDPNPHEMMLAGLGVFFSLPGGQGVDAAISTMRAIIAYVGRCPFSDALWVVTKRVIAHPTSVVGYVRLAGHFALGNISLDLAKEILTSEDLLLRAMKIADDLGDAGEPCLRYAINGPWTQAVGGAAAGQRVIAVLSDSLLTPAARSGLSALDAGQMFKAVQAIGKSTAAGVDPSLMNKLLNSPHVYSATYTHARMLDDLNTIADADNLRGFVGRLASGSESVAKGSRYELMVAAGIRRGEIPQLPQGTTFEFIERFARGADGKTDIDVLAKLPDGGTMFLQCKASLESLDGRAVEIWVRKVRSYADLNGIMDPVIRYVVPDQAIIDGAGALFQKLDINGFVHPLP